MPVVGTSVDASQKSKTRFLTLGKITSAFGIKGWMKVYSWTDPVENIFSYPKWFLKFPDGTEKTILAKSGRKHGSKLVFQIEGCHDRESAGQYLGALIRVPKDMLPSLDVGDYYWCQLEGLAVYTQQENGRSVCLGQVERMMATGANDVMVVRTVDKTIASGIDDKERFIPYVLGQVIRAISLEKQRIDVTWPLDF